MSDVIKPLFGQVRPFPGESLMSLIFRAAELNVFQHLSEMLHPAGISAAKPAFIPFSQTELVGPLSALLALDSSVVSSCMHRALMREGYADSIDWYGTPLPRKYVSTDRRISPRSFRKQRYDRAIWSIRALDFCPGSYERLIDRCPHCSGTLAWTPTQGIHVCGHCGRSLLSAKPGKIPWSQRQTAKLAADLVHPNRDIRAKALQQLPAPFLGWEPGDVFVAIIELGLLDSGMGELEFAHAAKQISAGDFSAFDVGKLVDGMQAILDWPRSVRGMLKREISYRKGGIQRCAGLFGRFLGSQMAGRPIVKLLQDEVKDALRGSDLPLGMAGVLPEWLKREDRISAKEAVARYGIDMKTLRRVNQKGRCVVRHQGGGERVRYNPKLLEVSVAAYKSSLGASAVSRMLGVPFFAIRDLEEIDLLSVVTDHDAFLLGAGEARFTKASAHQLVGALSGKLVTQGPRIVVADAMRGVLDPAHWVSTIRALMVEKVRLVERPATNCVPMRDLVVHAGDMLALQESWPDEKLPKGVAVPLQEAARLLGWTADTIGKAVVCLHAQTFREAEPFNRLSDLRVPLDQLGRLRGERIPAQFVVQDRPTREGWVCRAL